MSFDSNWDLETQDMVLGFEIGSYYANDRVKSWLRICSEEDWMCA